MAASELPKSLIDAGAKLLKALDTAGIEPQGAAWIFDHQADDWRYVIATSLIETVGRTGVYKRLLKSTPNLDIPKELSIAAIYLVPVDGPLFRTIAGAIRVQDGPVTISNCLINDMKVDAIIYRWRGEPSGNDAHRIERNFKRKANID
jgi:hypothetical protein